MDQLTEKIVSVISQVLEVKPVEALQAAMTSNDQENDVGIFMLVFILMYFYQFLTRSRVATWVLCCGWGIPSL